MRIGIAILCGILLANCAHAVSPPALPADVTALEPSRGLLVNSPEAASYQSLYRFTGAPRDGAGPRAGLVSFDGELYGTTMSGGKDGVGTVYKIGTSGAERVLYSFPAHNNGKFPESRLTVLDGALYGTTFGGGGTDCAGGCGSVFRISPSGAEREIYGFTGSTDGANPAGGLVAVNGTLYGTTVAGGCSNSNCIGSSCNCGTVFALTRSGSITLLHSFLGPTADGGYPYAGLTYANGALYGVTLSSVFKISTSGAFHVVHRFRGGGDGDDAEGTLLAVNGTIYGTTAAGGAGCRGSGCGTVFKVSTSGKEWVLYRFDGGKDGRDPTAGLIAINGSLYGTTTMGGQCSSGAQGCGTIFSVSASSGAERVLYRFKGGKDGKYPGSGDLIDVNGSLYDTTAQGGIKSSGTVYKFVP